MNENLTFHLVKLCQSLALQTEAINRLIESNQAIIDLLIESHADDVGEDGPAYLSQRAE